MCEGTNERTMLVNPPYYWQNGLIINNNKCNPLIFCTNQPNIHCANIVHNKCERTIAIYGGIKQIIKLVRTGYSFNLLLLFFMRFSSILSEENIFNTICSVTPQRGEFPGYYSRDLLRF